MRDMNDHLPQRLKRLAAHVRRECSKHFAQDRYGLEPIGFSLADELDRIANQAAKEGGRKAA